MAGLDSLYSHLRSLESALLGYSGGVDSALLAVAGARALGPDRFVAVMGRSASLPSSQAARAEQLAQEFKVPLLQIETEELSDPRYLENSTDRCYFCKSELWNRLGEIARVRGYRVVVDGTNADDLTEHRPGLRAATEYRVRSPLAELGWSKAQVREAARELNIPSWNAPAGPCLSSRVVYGLEITSERLRQVEEGEDFLRQLGVRGDLRVRHHGSKARLEVAADQMEFIRQNWSSIGEVFSRLGFQSVELDPRGYRRGGLLAIAPLRRG